MSVPSWLWIVASSVCVIGLALVSWSVWGDRSRGRRRCPRCWYSMQGVPGLRCPECGEDATGERSLFKPRRRWRFAAIGSFMCMVTAGGTLAHFGYQHRWHWAVLPKYMIVNSESRDGVSVRWLETRDPDAADWRRIVQVRERDRVIHEVTGFYFTTQWWPKPAANAPLGAKMLILTEDSGGTGCFAQQHVFAEESGSLELLDVIPYCGDFQDLDGDGMPEFIARDRTFAYWATSGADSPYPRVILKCQDGMGFEPALDLMRGPLPSDAELLQRLAAYRNASDQWTSKFAAVLEVTLDLIYSGHEDRAWAFLHEHWPQGSGGRSKDEFVRELKSRLRLSPFWPAIFALNNDSETHAAESMAAGSEP